MYSLKPANGSIAGPAASGDLGVLYAAYVAARLRAARWAIGGASRDPGGTAMVASAGHRRFLVVVTLDPAAAAAWMDRVVAGHRLPAWIICPDARLVSSDRHRALRVSSLPLDGSGAVPAPDIRRTALARLGVRAGMISLAMVGCVLASPVRRMPRTAPAAPGGLHVAAPATTSLSVAWSPVAGAARYGLFWLATSVSGSGAGSLMTSGPHAVIPGLHPGLAYEIWAQAWNAAGAGAPSVPVRAETYQTWDEVFTTDAPSVVMITGYGQTVASPATEPCGGTGFFISTHEILTAGHAVECAYRNFDAWVSNGNGKQTPEPATVVGIDAQDDLAILDLSGAATGTPLTLTSALPPPGEPVAVLGFPGLLPIRYSTGRVTGLSFNLDVANLVAPIPEVLHLTAAAMGGNSGSPVVDPYGRVVGVVESGSDVYENDVYAIPLRDYAQRRMVPPTAS